MPLNRRSCSSLIPGLWLSSVQGAGGEMNAEGVELQWSELQWLVGGGRGCAAGRAYGGSTGRAPTRGAPTGW